MSALPGATESGHHSCASQNDRSREHDAQQDHSEGPRSTRSSSRAPHWRPQIRSARRQPGRSLQADSCEKKWEALLPTKPTCPRKFSRCHGKNEVPSPPRRPRSMRPACGRANTSRSPRLREGGARGRRSRNLSQEFREKPAGRKDERPLRIDRVREIPPKSAPVRVHVRFPDDGDSRRRAAGGMRRFRWRSREGRRSCPRGASREAKSRRCSRRARPQRRDRVFDEPTAAAQARACCTACEQVEGVRLSTRYRRSHPPRPGPCSRARPRELGRTHEEYPARTS